MENERIEALYKHLLEQKEIDPDDKDGLEPASYDEKTIEYGKSEYLVVTDEEANQLWDEDLENYIDECILPEIPEAYRLYFDNEAWKRDAQYDGRAHSLARYDGDEYSVTINDTEYYIYRTN